jgi:xanthine/CO dehydrogenase XdhC/CoxF family maturation factor
MAEIKGSEPATIAVSVAADLLRGFQHELEDARAASNQRELGQSAADVTVTATRR